MTVSISWSEDDMRAHGRCGEPLSEPVVYTPLPPDGASTDDFDRKVILDNDPRAVAARGIRGIPEGESAFALEYQEQIVQLSREEARAFLEAHYQQKAAPDLPNRDRCIQDAIRAVLNGPGSAYSLGENIGDVSFEEGVGTRTTLVFSRWVTEREFHAGAEKVAEAAAQDGSVFPPLSRWHAFMGLDEQRQYCDGCQLDTHTINPETGAAGKFGCLRYSMESHFERWIEFVSSRAEFEVLSPELFTDPETEEIPVEDIPALIRDLAKSRQILMTEAVSGLIVLGKDGEVIQRRSNDSGQIVGDYQHGYGISFGGPDSLIEVFFKMPVALSLPAEDLQEIADLPDPPEIKLALILERLRDKFGEDLPMSFISVERRGDSFFGKTFTDQEIEIPAVMRNGQRLTPFSFVGARENEVERIEYAPSSAMQSFGVLQRWFERYAEISARLEIPIQIRG